MAQFTDQGLGGWVGVGVSLSDFEHAPRPWSPPRLRVGVGGAPLGLGVDGSSSNDSLQSVEAVRHALMLNRLTCSTEQVAHRDLLRWATEGSAASPERSDLGRPADGLEADLALDTLDELRFSGAHDLLAALVLCGAARADWVMVAGGSPAGGRRRSAGRGPRRPGAAHGAIATALFGRPA